MVAVGICEMRSIESTAIFITSAQVHLYVWEDCPEGLARHLLLTAVALDASLPPRQRAETLLELHGNALLRETTASYLGR